MLDSVSVRRSATELGVASTTTFRWRHRFLARTREDRPAQLGGITEADEMYVLESHKGSRTLDRAPRKRGGKATKRGISSEQVCVLVARDREGRTIDAVVGKGALTPQRLHMHLQARLAPDVPGSSGFVASRAVIWPTTSAGAGRSTVGALPTARHSSERRWVDSILDANSAFFFNAFAEAAAQKKTASNQRLRRRSSPTIFMDET